MIGHEVKVLQTRGGTKDSSAPTGRFWEGEPPGEPGREAATVLCRGPSDSARQEPLPPVAPLYLVLRNQRETRMPSDLEPPAMGGESADPSDDHLESQAETADGADGRGSISGKTRTLDRAPRRGRLFREGEVIANRYRIVGSLGEGGMGEVWHAFDLKLRVDVALKSLRAELVADDRRIEMLRSEVRSARNVISPNVCRVFDLEEIGEQELVSMEFVDGETLIDVMRARGPLDLAAANEIASQFLAGLAAIHEAGLVHRDLKPENIMVTRAGRVVIMDFGLAKLETEGSHGTMAGTPAYMPPEQRRGDPVDARTDIFAAGVVLAEMISTSRDDVSGSRRSLLTGIHQSPPRVPDGPWRQILSRAVAPNANDRYRSAFALARALEEVTLRHDDAEDRQPYPGLMAFTEETAGFFFGREAEVETLWKKLGQTYLLALIGPSGAGKSSFLRAGLIARKPENWRHAICHPGDAPFRALAQALVPAISGDVDAIHDLLRFEDVDTAVDVIGRWREGADEALLIVDQFEELFTLNPQEVTTRFAELLGRLPVECDVHVLLSMRDDFLLYCHDYEPLAPIFSELMPIKAPTGAALRRALVQPALACGYRFEDDALVDEMLGEIAHERGALPLLAFAASRLWEKRDRESGMLTRTAYEEIGGVGGALAQHAEATMERLGEARREIVREVFRNLVTAEGTRAVREMDELLSVFENEEAAREVIGALIDARLLTTYETAGASGDESERHVEIVHESLLDAWPRLVRWRTQDEDGAQLRDLLRQAAKMWEERNRSEDLLWSGSAYLDYRAWRERYSGGLSATEEAFARAMVSRANRQRRRRRVAVGIAFVLLAVVLGIFGVLWRQSESAREEAVAEARRAEASKLLGLGRLQLDESPTAALAYALASLELSDDETVRRFTVEVLERGPVAFSLGRPFARLLSIAFSPDGQWLAVGSIEGKIRLSSRDGTPLEPFDAGGGPVEQLAFSSDSRVLVSVDSKGRLGFWSVPEARSLRHLELGGPSRFELSKRAPELITATDSDGQIEMRAWPLDGGEPRMLGSASLYPGFRWSTSRLSIDPSGKWLGYATDTSVWVRPLEQFATEEPKMLGSHASDVRSIRFLSDGDRLASIDVDGEIRIWSTSSFDSMPLKILRGTEPPSDIYTGRGELICVGTEGSTTVTLNRIDGPSSAQPLLMVPPGGSDVRAAAFDPAGEWLASAGVMGVSFWPLNRAYPALLGGEATGTPTALGVAPDGSWVARAGLDGRLRWWQMEGSSAVRSRPTPPNLFGFPAVHPDGDRILIASWEGPVHMLSMTGNADRVLGGFSSHVFTLAISPDGRLAAGGGGGEDTSDGHVMIWDLESDTSRILDPQMHEFVGRVVFSSNRTLIVASESGVREWNLDDDTSRTIREWEKVKYGWVALSGDRRRLLSYGMGPGTTTAAPFVHDLATGEVTAIEGFGDGLYTGALNETGTLVATGDLGGVVRVGRVDGVVAPHLFFGHEDKIRGLAFLSGGRLVSAADGGAIRVWPLPDGPPLHTLAYEDLLTRLRGMTNYRAVRDEGSASGYRLEAEPFPGWARQPAW